MGVILMSSMIAINIVAMTNCISIAVAQYNPSTGHDTSSLSPPSTSSPSSPQSPSLSQSTSSPPPSPPPNEQPTKAPVVNTSSPSPPPNEQPTKAPVVNTSSPNVNSSTISSPPNPVIVGPSNYIASPITSGNQTNVNATSSPPSKGLFLGSSGG
jgi:hypothetical protein